MFKKKNKAMFICSILFLVVLLALVGCTSDNEVSSTSNDDETEDPEEGGEVQNKEDISANLKVLTVFPQDKMEAVLAEFNKEYPNIQVEFIFSWFDTLPAMIGAGDIPDITNGFDLEWVRNGLLEELGSHVEMDPDLSLDIWYEPKIDDLIDVDGNLWALPWQIDPNFGIVYNKDILDSFGYQEMPEFNSLTEFGDFLKEFWVVENGEQVMTTFIPGSTHGASIDLFTFAFLNGATAETFYDPVTRQVGFNDPLIVETLEFILDFRREVVDDTRLAELQATLPDGVDLVRGGKSALTYNPPDLSNYLYNEDPEVFGLTMMPASSIWFGGWTWSMLSGSENKEAAWIFLKWLTASQEGARALGENLGSFSAMKENHYLEEEIQTNPVAANFYQGLQNGKKVPYSLPVNIDEEFNTKWAEVIQGTLEPKAFLDHITEYTQILVDEYYAEFE